MRFDDSKVVFSRASLLTGRTGEMELPIPPEEFDRAFRAWKAGQLIQKAFPTLTREQREFIKTGITPDEWEHAFGDEEA